jgi:hypothetical protein
MRGHKITLEYTCDDDGVHVFCECGWRKHLGYSPSVEDAVAARDEHLAALPTAEETARVTA